MVLKFKNVDYSDWSPTWIHSKQPRKQRKYIINAPLHRRRKMIISTLSKELRELTKKRNLPVIVGDYVKILRGKFRGKVGYVVYVDTKRYRVYVDCVHIIKKNGDKTYYPLHPSKLMILKLNLTDKRRIEILKERKSLDEKTVEKLMSISITTKDDLKAVYGINKSFK